MKTKHRICGLITDFGNRDYFIGTMKAVIKRIAPSIEIIDICNDIPSYNILPACFTIDKTYSYFPKFSIFLVVVDPGVGTNREILLVEYDNRFFIGPDNGVLTPILQKTEKSVFVLDKKKYFLIEGNSTFEARDKMSPAAAYLSLGMEPIQLASPASDYLVNLDYFPTRTDNYIDAKIVYIDKFGNIMTNISREFLLDAQESLGTNRFKICMGGKEITGYYESYGNASANSCKTPFMLLGSHQNLEIAMNKQSAALELEAVIGQKLVVSFLDEEKEEKHEKCEKHEKH